MDNVTARVLNEHDNEFGEVRRKVPGATYSLPRDQAERLRRSRLIEIVEYDLSVLARAVKDLPAALAGIADPAYLAALLAHEQGGASTREAPRSGAVAALEKRLAELTGSSPSASPAGGGDTGGLTQ